MGPVPRAAQLSQLPSSERGLSDEEARRRLRECGPNEPAPTRRSGVLAALSDEAKTALWPRPGRGSTIAGRPGVIR